MYSESGLWADQSLVLCRRAASSSKPSSSLTSFPNTLMGYNKPQLSFFVVEVDLYLAALTKSFDVLLRYTASFSAFCLPCWL